jgi:hypothetical protein
LCHAKLLIAKHEQTYLQDFKKAAETINDDGQHGLVALCQEEIGGFFMPSLASLCSMGCSLAPTSI